MELYGLIGKKLGHSFSPGYFHEKFKKLDLHADYKLFEIEKIELLQDLISKYSSLNGFNVTVPYKQEIIRFMDFLSEEAQKTNAVNTVKISRDSGKTMLLGYNTDILGFEYALQPLIQGRSGLKATVLGNGGSAGSVCYVLDKLKIDYLIVSRKPAAPNHIHYFDIDNFILNQYHLIVNTSPLGMFPAVDEFPDIPYKFLTADHILFDLIYNPEETLFLSKGKLKGATTSNGLTMLKIQADEAWKIWCSD